MSGLDRIGKLALRLNRLSVQLPDESAMHCDTDPKEDCAEAAKILRELRDALGWYAHEVPDDYEIYAGGKFLMKADDLFERARRALQGDNHQ